MGRYFNTEGCCYPGEHYMVNLDSRLKEIKSMVDAGKYFTINRGRQYGKTTVLKELEKYLSSDYLVVSLDFLDQLRGYYLNRDEVSAFHSVILAGVHDIRNIRQKIRPDAEHKHNSPWNISADFNVDI